MSMTRSIFQENKPDGTVRLAWRVITNFVATVSVSCLLFGSTSCSYPSVEGDEIDASGNAAEAKSDESEDGDKETEEETDKESKDSKQSQSKTPPPAGTQSSSCSEDGLVLCLDFEGDTTDRSEASLVPTTTNGITFVAGKQNQAAQFDGKSALRFSANTAFELPPKSAAIEAWIKRDNAGADAVVFDADKRLSLTINAAGKVWCKSSAGAVTGKNVVPVNEWAHVACVVDGTKLRAYLNGATEAEGAGSAGSSPNVPAAVGGNSPKGEPFLGAIDSLRVFRVTRTSEQIAKAAQ